MERNTLIIVSAKDALRFLKEHEREMKQYLISWLKKEKQITNEEFIDITIGNEELEVRFASSTPSINLIPIKGIPMSTALKNLLKEGRIDNLNDLAENWTKEKLRGIRNMGPKRIEELEKILKEHQLSLKKN